MADAVLRTESLTVAFGGLVAVNDVTLECRRGQLTGLIGPNGAGKTTFIDAVTGFLPHNASGSVLLEGTEVFGRPAHQLAHQGLTRTWQTLELFDDISVRSNLGVASERLTFTGAVRDFFRPRRRDERVEEVIELLDLGAIADHQPSELSQGQRKLVGVGRALASATTKILLLDEPAAGLDKSETEWFGAQLRRLVDQGVTMLLVDHDMGLVLSVCDFIHMLVFGGLAASGTPQEMRGDPRVIAAYLGRAGGET
ncbi:MAG: ATP-binding cassette domain-containing protein [bacterium]|nr:ATP-binding cassette domain-containing protein [bacterium]MCY4273015.1 ATP-binding cassette domain-containing protein [bacterium]